MINLTNIAGLFKNFFKNNAGVNTKTASDNGTNGTTNQNPLDKEPPKWYNNESFLNKSSGLLGAAGGGLVNFATINSSTANNTIKNMAKADAGVDALASGLSVLGPWGTAAGLALKGFNTLGSGLVGTPNAYKNFALNNDVAASASMGGIAHNSADMSQTIDAFKQSGFFGKLFGKKSSDTRKANDLMQKQSDAMNILDDNKKAFEQATTSTDLFSTRNQFNLNGLNNFRNFQIGKTGLKFKEPMATKKLVKKAQKGGYMDPYARAEQMRKQKQATTDTNKAKKAKEQQNYITQINKNAQRAATGANAPKSINVADNKVAKWDDAKKAEFAQWKQSQGQSQPAQVAQSNRGYYNPTGYLGNQQPAKPAVQNVVPTKTATSTQASTPVQGRVANSVKPVGTTQVASTPIKSKQARPMETVSDLWQKVTGTSWTEARAQGLTDGSLRNNLDLLKRLKGGENPLETMRLAKEQEALDKKNKITALANTAMQRSFNASLPQPVLNTSEGSDTVLSSLKKGGSISEKKCLKPKLKRSKRVEA